MNHRRARITLRQHCLGEPCRLGLGMSTQREKDLARQKAARDAKRREEAAASTKRTRTILGIALALGLLLAGGYFIANAQSSDEPAATPTTTDDAAQDPSSVNCEDPAELQTQATQFPEGPTGITLATDAELGLQITTNCGPLEIVFDAKNAPKNTSSMIFLANTGAPQLKEPGNEAAGTVDVEGYFDNTACHRLTTSGIFVLQCGDPTGTGRGGPGFTTPDENTDPGFESGPEGTVIYPAGTIAMANSGPDTNGSQFFIVYEDSPLAPDYTVVGKLSKGLPIIQKVADEGVVGGGTDGKPAETIALSKVLSFERREVQPQG